MEIYFDMVQMIELLAIFANISLIVTVLILSYRTKTKNKISSIKYCRDLLDVIKDDKDLRKTNNLIIKGKESDCKDIDIENILNEYDDLALYWREGIVKIKHINQMHGAILDQIKTSKKIQEFIEKKTE